MTKPIARDLIYRRRAFDADIIELCVRWYHHRRHRVGPSNSQGAVLVWPRPSAP
jgi:hypothetical protein